MDKDNKIALLYFLEEALGFRVGLHWLRRYLEQGQDKDLENLVITVIREHVFDYDQWSEITDGQDFKMPLDQAIAKIKSCVKEETLLDLVDDQGDFAAIIGRYFGSQSWVVSTLAKAIETVPSVNWKDALSRNQIKSKLWLLENMDRRGWLKPDSKILLVGGWVGILPFLISVKGYAVAEVINVDLDVAVHPVARILNHGADFKFTSVKKDVRSLDLGDYEDYIIVDTIVEHFADHGLWLESLPADTKVVLQGNNMFGLEDHVNCHHDVFEFLESCGIPIVHYLGFKDLYRCDRFMLIGETR